MSEKLLEITECDEAGNVTATYVQSPTSQNGKSRVDVILPEVMKSPWQQLLDVFLPVGYPLSVTSDYLEYQIYDSLQAFSSSIAGLLSSRAVLSSVGVGDASASPTAALLLSILQDSAGRIATILFAHRFGTSLEPECKMYRLLADILNDLAFVLDCLSPAFPKPIRVVILSFSSVLRALCGVAAGSAKASLSAHFARWGNLGELNAKDSSQETVISLLGMLVGSLVVSWVTTPVATWTTLILLLSIHLETNRRAVRAVSMRTLNRQRATLVFHHLQRGHVPTPEEVSRQERIFERDAALRDAKDQVRGYCKIGVSLSHVLRLVGSQNSKTRSTEVSSSMLPDALALSKDQGYMMFSTTTGGLLYPYVVIKTSGTPRDLLIAWFQALLLTGEDPKRDMSSDASLHHALGMMEKYEGSLTAAGWDLDAGALETASSTRVKVDS